MEEDIPPEWMWPFDEALKEWFEEVKANRESPSEPDDRTVVEMMDNELTKGRRPQ
jgi:hypothetical protein